MPKKNNKQASAATVQMPLVRDFEEGQVETVLVPIEKITNRIEKPTRYTSEEWPSYVEVARVAGIKTPPLVYPDGDGYGLEDGRHRVLAAQTLGWTSILCTLNKRASAKTRAMTLLVVNKQSQKSTPLEEAEAFREALDAGWSKEQAAQYGDCSVATLESRLKLLDIPRAVAERLGMDLNLDVTEAFTPLIGHELLMKCAAGARVPKGAQRWRVMEEVLTRLQEKGLLHPADLTWQQEMAIGGDANKTWKRRIKKLGRIDYDDTTYTTEPGKFLEIYADEKAKWEEKQAELTPEEAVVKKVENIEEVIDRRVKNKLPDHTIALIEARFKGLLDWSPDMDAELYAVILDYRVEKRSVWKMLCTITGRDQKELERLVGRNYKVEEVRRKEAILKMRQDDELAFHKLIGGILALRALGWSKKYTEDDPAKTWTGRTVQEIEQELAEQVKADLNRKKRKKGEAAPSADGEATQAADEGLTAADEDSLTDEEASLEDEAALDGADDAEGVEAASEENLEEGAEAEG